MLPSLNQKCRVVSSECQLMCPYFSEKYCTLQNLTQGVVLNSPMLSVYHPPHQSVFMQQLKTVQVVNTRSLQGYSYVYFTSYYELIFVILSHHYYELISPSLPTLLKTEPRDTKLLQLLCSVRSSGRSCKSYCSNNWTYTIWNNLTIENNANTFKIMRRSSQIFSATNIVSWSRYLCTGVQQFPRLLNIK